MTPNPTTQQETLLPCPFCGVAPTIQSHTQEDEMDEGRYVFFVECGNRQCPMGLVSTGGPFREAVKAVECWNTRRAAVAGPRGVIELLSASLLHPESAEGYVRQAIEMLSAAATSSPTPAESVADGWVTFGRVKVDIENETETFERIHPPVAAPADNDDESLLPELTAVFVTNAIRVHTLSNHGCKWHDCLADVCYNNKELIQRARGERPTTTTKEDR